MCIRDSPLQSRRGTSAKGSGMFALESQPTDAWWGECFVCAGEMRITSEASRIRVYVIPTDEERMIAEHTAKHVA